MSQSITINACTWSIHYIIKTLDYTWIITYIYIYIYIFYINFIFTICKKLS